MREHNINSYNNFIAGWYLEDTTVCDDIMQYINVSKKTITGAVFDGVGNRVVDREVKYSKDCRLDYCEELLDTYRKNLRLVIGEYYKKYEWSNKFGAIDFKEYTNIQHYPPNGGFFKHHTERGGWGAPAIERVLVFMTYLNTVDVGGETEFFYQDVKVKPEKGLTIIWPAEWTHVHRGLPAPNEHKYVVTGWLHYLNPEENIHDDSHLKMIENISKQVRY